jgi:hypothetical protein
MDGVKGDELLESLRHPIERRRKALELLADLGLLRGVLAEKPFLDDICDVLARDADLLEPVTHAPNSVRRGSEPRVVEQRLLDTRDEPEACRPTNLADLAQEREVDDQLSVSTGAQVVQEFVEHEQQSAVGLDFLKSSHHVY